VPNFLRPLSARSVRAPLTLSLIVAALVVVGACAAPAGAYIAGEFGMNFRTPTTPINSKKPLQYHGGPVITASNTYTIYWDPAGSYRNDWMTLIDRYFHDVGAASGQLGTVFSLDGQYTGPGGTRANYKSTWRGAYSDTETYPASGCGETSEVACISDAQIRTELKRFIAAEHLPVGVNVIYFLLTPPGVTVCTDSGGSGNCSNNTSGGTPNGICGYHSAIEPTSSSPIVYGVQPWIAGNAGHVLQQVPLVTEDTKPEVRDCQNGTALNEPNQTGARSPFGDYETGLADVIINGLSIQQNNIVVDPLLNGWYQETTGAEQSDMCLRAFSPAPEELPKVPATTHALNLVNETINSNHYYLQWGFSSVGVTSGKGIVCWEGTELTPHFTAPNPVNPGDIVGFDANESGIALEANTTNLPANEPFTAPLYKWDFGDGTTIEGTNPSAYHPYQRGGTYNVTLTVTDSGGNHGSVTSAITVTGESPSGAGGSATSSQPGSGGQPPAGGSGSGAGHATKHPVATAAAVSHSLRSVLRGGLLVRYSVSEQVAGHVEVLLASSTARRLGLHGPLATGLARGTAPQIVIGKAILVTTKAGRSTVDIVFSKRTASRLARLHGVSLMLRLVVRNAENQSVTFLGAVTLSH
jgi:PKD domain